MNDKPRNNTFLQVISWFILVIGIVVMVFITMTNDLYSGWDIPDILQTTQPGDPVNGAMWYDELRNALFTFEDGVWNAGQLVPDIEPINPLKGDMWFDEANDLLYTYYDEPLTVDKVVDKLQDGGMWRDWAVFAMLLFFLRLTFQLKFIDSAEEKNKDTKDLKDKSINESNKIRKNNRRSAFKKFVDNDITKEKLLTKHIEKLDKKINRVSMFKFLNKKSTIVTINDDETETIKQTSTLEKLIKEKEEAEEVKSLLGSRNVDDLVKVKKYDFSKINIRRFIKPRYENILDAHLNDNNNNQMIGDFNQSVELTKSNFKSLLFSALTTILGAVFLADLFINFSSFQDEVFSLVYNTLLVGLTLFFAYMTAKAINKKKNYELHLSNSVKERFNENVDMYGTEYEEKQMDLAMEKLSEMLIKKTEQSENGDKDNEVS